MTESALTAFATLFVVIDPIGLLPIFIALTQGRSAAARRRIALTACGIAVVILALFGLVGEAFLDLIGIGMPAFRIAGGLLLFLIALEMLFERRAPRRAKAAGGETVAEDDPAVFPLAVPLIAGPGAMATMILLFGGPGVDAGLAAVLLLTMAAVVGCALGLFLLAAPVEHALGEVGITVVTRLLGMLLAALSVQFVLDGLAQAGLAFGGGAG